MGTDRERASVLKSERQVKPRKLRKVPFVELYNHRLQGVVSSGSDPKRVYVSFFEAGTGNYYCSTNNNRRCGGLYGPCKHLRSLLDEAIKQYGAPEVGRYLQLDTDLSALQTAWDILSHLQGSEQKEQAGEVFSRFLNYLRYLELEEMEEPLPEMTWFVSG